MWVRVLLWCFLVNGLGVREKILNSNFLNFEVFLEF